MLELLSQPARPLPSQQQHGRQRPFGQRSSQLQAFEMEIIAGKATAHAEVPELPLAAGIWRCVVVIVIVGDICVVGQKCQVDLR